MKNGLSYEEIKKYIENENCFLLSKEYLGSDEKIEIECSCGNKWRVKFYHFKKSKMCPKCGYKKARDKSIKAIIKKKGSLINTHPELLLEWDFEKNDGIFPKDFSYGSKQKVWWRCHTCGYKWLTSINARTNNKTSCGKCAGNTITLENNLKIMFPKILDEWDYKNNGDASNYASHSDKRVSWICKKCNNRWESPISYRTSKDGSGCPKCIESLGEKRISDFLFYNKIENNFNYRFKDCRDVLPLPFDFYIPKYKVCIEYQGITASEIRLKDRKHKDLIKENYCLQNNISLIKIPYWEYDNIEKILSDTFIV